MKSLLITLPSDIEWSDYQKEIDAVKDGTQEMNFRVPMFPKMVSVGDKCYLCWRGNIVGWMRISSIGEKVFKSTTDGRKWFGKFVSRSGPFHRINPVPHKGFQGFRYIDDAKLTESINEEMHVPDIGNVQILIDNVIKKFGEKFLDKVYNEDGIVKSEPYENEVSVSEIINPCVWLDDSSEFKFIFSVVDSYKGTKDVSEFDPDSFNISNGKMCNALITIYFYIKEKDFKIYPNIDNDRLYKLRELLRHEIEHAYKTFRQKQGGSKTLADEIDINSYIRKYKNAHEFEPNFSSRAFYYFGECLYRTIPQEIEAYTNEFYQQLYNNKEQNLDISNIKYIPLYVYIADLRFDLESLKIKPNLANELFNEFCPEAKGSAKDLAEILYNRNIEDLNEFIRIADSKLRVLMYRMGAVYSNFMSKEDPLTAKDRYEKRLKSKNIVESEVLSLYNGIKGNSVPHSGMNSIYNIKHFFGIV